MNWFQRKLQHLLGTYDLNLRLNNLAVDNIHLESQLKAMRTEIKVSNRALGRVIAKIDPIFLVPEDDPVRKAASDAAGDAVIAKLLGEHIMSTRLTGET